MKPAREAQSRREVARLENEDRRRAPSELFVKYVITTLGLEDGV